MSDRPLSNSSRIATAGLAGTALGAVAMGQWLALLWLQPGAATDAWLAGQIVPTLITAVVSSAVINVLLSEFARRNEAAELWALLGLGLLASGGLALVLVLAAPLWARLLFPGLDAATLELAVRMCRIQTLALVPLGWIAVATAKLQGRGRFVVAELAAAVAGVGFLAAVRPAIDAGGIELLAWLWPARAAAHAVILAIWIGRPHRPAIERKTLTDLAGRMTHLARAQVVYKSGPLVDAFLVSWAPAGSLTLLGLAHRAVNFVTLLLDRAVGRPAQRDAAADPYGSSAARVVRHALWLSLPVVLIGYAVHAVAGVPIISAVAFGRLDDVTVTSLWRLVLILGVALIANTIGHVFLAVLLARGSSRTVARVAVRGFFASTLGKAVMLPFFGVYGLAAGTVIYKLFTACFYAAAAREPGESRQPVGPAS